MTFLKGRRQTKKNQVERDDISEMVYYGDTEESESDSDHEHTEGMADILNSNSLCEFISHPANVFCMYAMSSVSHASISNNSKLEQTLAWRNLSKQGLFYSFTSQSAIDSVCPYMHNLNKSYLVG